MRCLTVFVLFMWILVVSLSSDYWLGISPRVTLIALVDVEVCLGIPLCVTCWVPCGSPGLILGSTGRGRLILGSTGRGRPLLYPVSVFPTVTTSRNQDKKVVFIRVYEDGAPARSYEFMKTCHNMNIVVQTTDAVKFQIRFLLISLELFY